MDNKKDDFNPILYALYMASKEFKKSLEEYEYTKNVKPEIANDLSSNLTQMISNYKFSLDSLTEMLPSKYRMVYNIVKDMRFDQTIDIASNILKEYAKSEDGSFKSFDETLRKMLVKILFKNILTG